MRFTHLTAAVVLLLPASALWAQSQDEKNVLVRTPNGDEDKKKTTDVEKLTAELKAQKEQLDAQKAEIEALKKSRDTYLNPERNAPVEQDKQGPVDVKSKWETKLYGFVEADFISDSTETFSDAPGNPVIAINNTYGGVHKRLQFGVRNSRLGFDIKAPEFEGIKASAKAEMDFLGNQPNAAGGVSEAGFFNNPTFRIRHMWLKLQTEYVDFQIGQGWELFGWQPYFNPCTVDIQGVPGEIYSRTIKLQASHVFHLGGADLEAAIAASRPPQRDAYRPDGQAGLKISFPDWTGVHTLGSTGTSNNDPLAFGISGRACRFDVPRPAGSGGGISVDQSISVTGMGAAADLFVPILRPEKDSRGNALSLTAEYVYGQGINDLYSGFNGGIGGIGAATGAGALDSGLAFFNPTNGALEATPWQTDIIGLQYYLPDKGNIWIAANYSSGHNRNAGQMFLNSSAVLRSFWWANVDVFWDITPAVRLGLSFDYYHDTYVGGAGLPNGQTPEPIDRRVQFSAFFLF